MVNAMKIKYTCLYCNRVLELDEKISHCPFCGTPYANHSPTNPISEIKMIIGSDGERTIQEKYWRDAQYLLNKLRAILSDRIERYTITANDDIFNRQGFHFINHNQLDTVECASPSPRRPW